MTNEMHICPICNQMFAPMRRDAIYCSGTCRQRSRRAKLNKTKSSETVDYKNLISIVHKLAGAGQQNKIRALILESIHWLDDTQRAKLYNQIDSDFYRIRDKVSNG